MSEKRTAIIISGMHRCGTSSVSGVVHLLGASLPAHLLPVQPNNPRGFFESKKVVSLNDRILSDSGTSWLDWRSVSNEWPGNPNFQKFLDEALQILAEEYGDSDFIVIKDPRFAKIFPFWKIALKRSKFRICNIIPVRHPEEVAASLYKRDAISKNQARLLWARHVLDAEKYSRNLPRAFVFWDAFMGDWEREAVRMASQLDITWPRLTDQVRAEVEQFLTPELRHHRETEEPGAYGNSGNVYVNEAYAALKLFDKDPNSREATGIFDSIRADYLRTERIYGPVFADMDAARIRTERERDQARSRVAELDNALGAAVCSRDTAAAESERTGAELVAAVRERNLALEDGSALTVELVQTRSRLLEAVETRDVATQARDAAIQARDTAVERAGRDCDAAIERAGRERDAAIEQAASDRDAWSLEMHRKTGEADSLARQLITAQRRFRQVQSRLDEFQNMNVFRKLLSALKSDGRYFDCAGIAAELSDEDVRVGGDSEDTVSTAATLGLKGILRLNGVEFLDGVYGRLLMRRPDQGGLSFYLQRLLRGTPKIQILAEIAASTEARNSGVIVPGLSSAVRMYRASRLPFLGLIFRLFSNVEGNSAADQRLRAIEQALYLKNH